MLRVFLDTEFTGFVQDTTLISIGLVSKGGTFYAEFNDYDETKIDSWLEENILRNLKFRPPKEGEDEYLTWDLTANNLAMRGNKSEIAEQLTDWLQRLFGVWPKHDRKHSEEIHVPSIEIWSDCLAYDWVLFCDLWGGVSKVPKCVYYIPYDICTSFKERGIDPDIDRKKFIGIAGGDIKKHNALWDAKVIKLCYERLMKTSRKYKECTEEIIAT